MKNILPLLAFLFLPAMPFAQDYAWYSGKVSPYSISTEADLIGLRQLISSNSDNFDGKIILLANDIALTSDNWTPIGSGTYPFKGTLDGQGYTISGLAVSGVNLAGLFGYVGANGQIKNLNVEATTIATPTGGTATRYAGGLAAYYASAKPIENCSVKAASITGNSGSNVNGYGGGLVGYASAALTITNSYASGNVIGRGTDGGYGYGGGLVGYANAALTITNSYASGNVTGRGAVSGSDRGYGGGLVGYASAALTITNSYASGNVASRGGYRGYGGGLVGYANDTSTITTSYASGTISVGNTDCKGGIFGYWTSGTNAYVYYNSSGASVAAGLGSPTGILDMSSTTLKKQGTYINWDFNEIWGIVEDVSYPYLKINPSKITVPISDNVEAEYLPVQNYTGSQIKPDIIVRRISNGAVLRKDVDYVLTYGANKNVITPGTVTIIGIDSYLGLEESVSFNIIPKSVTISNAAAQNKEYDGTTEAAITGATLVGVLDGDTNNVSVSNLTAGAFATANAGTSIAVNTNMSLSGTAAANYKLTQPTGLKANITKKDLTITLNPKTVKIRASDSMSVANRQIVYNGLVNGENSSVISGTSAIYKDAIPLNTTPAAGTYPITLGGTRSATNYNVSHDNSDLYLKVVGDPVELSTCAVTNIPAQDYTSSQITPAVTVSCGSTTLVSPTDYTISYGANKDAGATAGKVTITAAAESELYIGSIEKIFTINKKAITITGAQVTEKTYDGTTAAAITGATVEGILEGDTSNVSVSEITGSFATASAGTEIDVSINASLSGAAAANYSITQQELKGTITAKPLAQDAIQAIASQTYTGSAITPSVTVKDGSKILAVGSDYTLSVINNTNTGTASVLVTGKGNYKGTADTTFAILPKALSNSMIAEIANQFYTGKAITPHITVKDGARTLAEGADYEVSYSNNTNTGFASVSITGKGNYAGEATAHFGITESTPIRTPQIAASQIRAQSAANAITLQNLPQNAKIEAYNLQGKQIYSSTSHSPLATSLNIPVQTKGIYIVKISLGSQKQILRIPVK